MTQENVYAKKPQIVIIDDEEQLVKSIQRALKDDYALFVAYSGEQGLKLARKTLPDLIILDIMMPDMDGYETCQALRADPILQNTPILFLSALSNVEAKITGFEVGADDYLAKPFDLRELRLRIKAIIRRHAHQKVWLEDEILQMGDIILNCSTFTVTTQSGRHELTPLEFDILHYFITHPGQVFTSIKLLDEIWAYPPDTGSPDLVRMHIKNLRYKIEPNPQNPIYLKTIRRHGYTLSPGINNA